MFTKNKKAETPNVSAGSKVKDYTAQKGPIILEIAPMASIHPMYMPALWFPISLEYRDKVTPLPNGKVTEIMANPIINLYGSITLGV